MNELNVLTTIEHSCIFCYIKFTQMFKLVVLLAMKDCEKIIEMAQKPTEWSQLLTFQRQGFSVEL